MKIGKFAEYCGTKISILRHYDKEELLLPERIDIFTGYRYYSPSQKAIFDRITALKKAGFTLHEIKKIISFSVSEKEIDEMFAQKADGLYMLIKLREFEAMRGGQPTILALKQVDTKEYTPEMIAIKDDIDTNYYVFTRA